MAMPRDLLHPIVLVGGRSARFGRDKLREPLDAGWLVDRAIAALRESTGRAVTLVGACDPDVATRGDAQIDDAHEGHGPAGGVLTALERLGDVIVLPGDLPRVRASTIASVIAAAERAPEALVVRAKGEPLVAVYRRALVGRIAARIAEGRRSLHDLATPEETIEVDVREEELVNANTPEVLDVPANVWGFEGIDVRLELVPLAARRALDRAGLHLSLETWRALELDARRAMVTEGAREVVDVGAVRTILAGTATREIDAVPELDAAAPPAALRDAIGARLGARWPTLRALERFALVHGMKSASRRGDPSRLDEVVRAVLG
ncbi:nitrate reductase associated protein [Sandaracinus amylolyticus]|uniref:nitrate reductase associated protein n=1 Tax=Sandaracinus amylolyticus TaxID=927083 RepID=UPI001F470DFE|nr:nitrate reductase associated protein [Sandaracinus amylolyticus]UJR84118.1 Hypothetical protein I5071_61890 [Sandaracinus amylolyticus]